MNNLGQRWWVLRYAYLPTENSILCHHFSVTEGGGGRAGPLIDRRAGRPFGGGVKGHSTGFFPHTFLQLNTGQQLEELGALPANSNRTREVLVCQDLGLRRLGICDLGCLLQSRAFCSYV